MSDVDLLSEAPQWSDVTPATIPVDARAAVSIQYSEEYEDALGLLYACIEAGETSERVLKLTEKCITLSPSHYTVWQHRFRCLIATDADMDEEWNICLAIASTNAKNYQLWNHRRKCAMRMGPRNALRELEFASSYLELDAKNYHIWAHRQVLVAAFGLWKQEWAYAERMISDDRRNNSAWNQRAWLLGRSINARVTRQGSPSGSATTGAQLESVLDQDPSDLQPRFLWGSVGDWLEREAQFVQDIVALMPHNESAWNYLLGLRHVVLDALCSDLAGGGALPKHREAGAAEALQLLSHKAFRIAIDAASAHPACVPARAALFKLYLAAAEAGGPGAHGATASGARDETAKLDGDNRQRAIAAVQVLRDALVAMDPIHAGWYRAAVKRVALA